MGEAGLGACAGFLMVEVSDFPLGVELVHGPLMGRALLRDMFRGCCGLRKFKHPVNVLGCTPTLLVVWSEASQHLSLQAVGWSQILDTMSPARCQPLDKYSCICFPPAFMS